MPLVQKTEEPERDLIANANFGVVIHHIAIRNVLYLPKALALAANLENILSKYDLNLPQDKVKALHECEKLISETYSSAERDIYIQNISKIFGVDAKSIKSDVDRIITKATTAKRKEESNKIKQDAIGYSDKVNPDYIKAPAVAKNEETVIGILLLYPEHRKKTFEGNLLSAEDFITDLNKRVFEYLKNAYFNSDDSHLDIDEKFGAEEVGRIMKMKISRMPLSDNGDQVLLDSINSLKRAVSKKNSQQTNTYEELNRLLQKKRQD